MSVYFTLRSMSVYFTLRIFDRFVLKEPKDGEWGVYKDGGYSGLVGQLVSKVGLLRCHLY